MSKRAEKMPQAPASNCGYKPREGRTVGGVDIGRVAACAAQRVTDAAVDAAMARLPMLATEALRAAPPINFANNKRSK